MQLLVDIAQLGKVPVCFCDRNGGLVDPVDGLEHAGLAEQSGSIVQELR